MTSEDGLPVYRNGTGYEIRVKITMVKYITVSTHPDNDDIIASEVESWFDNNSTDCDDWDWEVDGIEEVALE